MSGLNLFLSAGTVPQGTQLPASAQALINLVAQYMGIAGGGAFNGINFGATTPAPQNRGLPWFKTDNNGNPVGLFSWNGTAWVTIPSGLATGPTLNRPANPSGGQTYFDTDIKCAIIFSAAQNDWTTLGGSVGEVKEVEAATLAAALLANPGWVQHTASLGCVIGGACDAATGVTAAHPPGQLIGEEAHTLLVTELPAHTHPEAFAQYTGQHQNGSQPAGVYPAVTPGSLGLPVANTAPAGGGAAHNNIQPTYYLYRLKKSF